MIKFNKELENEKNKIGDLEKEVENLNKDVITLLKSNYIELSKENLNSSLMIISPILYVNYMEKIELLDTSYKIINELTEIKEKYGEIFENSNKNRISFFEIGETSGNDKLSGKLILVAGIVLGLFFGMFVAIIKEPLIKIIRELKEEK